MPSTFFKRSHFLRSFAFFATASALLAVDPHAALPDGPGKQTTVHVCGTCHAPERVTSLHQSRGKWQETISKMVSMGANASDDQLNSVLLYLSKSFPPSPVMPIDVNTASPVDLESSLLLLKSEARAVIQYRNENGGFHSLDDLHKVPGLNFKKIEENKALIVF